MTETVWFADARQNHFRNTLTDIDLLLSRSGLESVVKKGDLVAVKIHCGEWGNAGHVRPQWVARVVRAIRKLGAHPFLTDTCTALAGLRKDAVGHLRNAVKHGFDWAVVEAPFVVADGLRGLNDRKVEVAGHSVRVASDIDCADALIVVTHWKLHELAGFGGAIKNLGIGCSSKAGKVAMHMSRFPRVNARCTGCRRCVDVCEAGAIELADQKARIVEDACVRCGACTAACPENAIPFEFDTPADLFLRRIVRSAAAVAHGKRDKMLCINFIANVSATCDCVNFTPERLVRDVGTVAARNPVACDQACADLVDCEAAHAGLVADGEDLISSVHPTIPWKVQLEYAEELAIGNRSYKLEDVSRDRQRERRHRIAQAIVGRDSDSPA